MHLGAQAMRLERSLIPKHSQLQSDQRLQDLCVYMAKIKHIISSKNILQSLQRAFIWHVFRILGHRIVKRNVISEVVTWVQGGRKLVGGWNMFRNVCRDHRVQKVYAENRPQTPTSTTENGIRGYILPRRWRWRWRWWWWWWRWRWRWWWWWWWWWWEWWRWWWWWW